MSEGTLSVLDWQEIDIGHGQWFAYCIEGLERYKIVRGRVDEISTYTYEIFEKLSDRWQSLGMSSSYAESCQRCETLSHEENPQNTLLTEMYRGSVMGS